jgi:hypothetical protein
VSRLRLSEGDRGLHFAHAIAKQRFHFDGKQVNKRTVAAPTSRRPPRERWAERAGEQGQKCARRRCDGSTSQHELTTGDAGSSVCKRTFWLSALSVTMHCKVRGTAAGGQLRASARHCRPLDYSAAAGATHVSSIGDAPEASASCIRYWRRRSHPVAQAESRQLRYNGDQQRSCHTITAPRHSKFI